MSRILIIEDEPDIQTVLRFNLEKDGHHVLVASNGNDGLHELRRSTIDLVLLDLMLPDRDGLEVCRVIRADPSLAGIPVIMLTAKGEESDVVIGLGLGADDYVAKPLRIKELMARIKVTEFKLVHYLASHAGIAYERYGLLDRIGDGESIVTDRTIDVHIRNLRRKIEPYDHFIETVRGVGYRFSELGVRETG